MYVVQWVYKGPSPLNTNASAAARIRKSSAECQLLEAAKFLLVNSKGF